MNMQHRNTVLFGLLCGTDHHFMGDSAGEQDHKIRRTDLLFHGAVFLGENLGLIPVLFADFLLAADHTFITANDNNAHKGILSL